MRLNIEQEVLQSSAVREPERQKGIGWYDLYS